jgi:SAM-dependent methyltransferase
MKILVPPKFQFLYKKLKGKNFKLLDVGCGNNSPSITKYWFPNCLYYGLDKDIGYNNTYKDMELMDGFYEMDLADEQFGEIPLEYFDVIVMTHIIEHLFNGDNVIIKLLTKLKPGGYLYLEYPSFKSTKFPSMKGTLNFFDDPTHCRLYSQIELYNLFLRHNCKIIQGGLRRNIKYILLTPLRSLYDLIRYGYVNGSVVWDLMGFVEYITVQKMKTK